MNCPKHNVELVHREGISKKTGNPYDFWACPSKENGGFCDYTSPSVAQKVEVPGTPSNAVLLQGILNELIKIREIVVRQSPPIIEESATDDSENLPF